MMVLFEVKKRLGNCLLEERDWIRKLKRNDLLELLVIELIMAIEK